MTDVIMALMFTILIEIVVLILLKANKKVIYISLLANTVTNLALNIISYNITDSTKNIIFIAIMEIAIIPIVEAIFYSFVEKKFLKCLIYSVLANLASFLFSFVLMGIDYCLYERSILAVSIILSLIIMGLLFLISYLIRKRYLK